MKNKTALYVAIVVLVVVLIGGYAVVKILTKPAPETQEEQEILDLPPADSSIIVDLKKRADDKYLILTVSKIPSGTDSIEYDLSYDTDKGINTGAYGKVDLNGKSEITKEILLGTQSKNNFKYDTGVTSVDLVLKFNHPDGASQFTKTFSLE